MSDQDLELTAYRRAYRIKLVSVMILAVGVATGWFIYKNTGVIPWRGIVLAVVAAVACNLTFMRTLKRKHPTFPTLERRWLISAISAALVVALFGPVVGLVLYFSRAGLSWSDTTKLGGVMVCAVFATLLVSVSFWRSRRR